MRRLSILILALACLAAPLARAERGHRAQRSQATPVVRSFLPPQARLRLGLFIGRAIANAAAQPAYNEVNPWTGASQRLRLTPQQEIALGEQLYPTVVAQNGGLHADPVVSSYVNAVGQRLVARNGLNRSPYRFQFHVLATSMENAFAAPGGRLYVTTGLLKNLGSEAELALVMGHELGHVVARHSSQKLAKSDVARSVLEAAHTATSGLSGQQAAMLRAGLDTKLSLLAYDRQDEFEADDFGLTFTQGAGYDGHTAVTGFSRMLLRTDTGTPEALSDHPDGVSRVGRMLGRIARQGLQTGDPGVQGYETFVRSRL